MMVDDSSHVLFEQQKNVFHFPVGHFFFVEFIKLIRNVNDVESNVDFNENLRYKKNR